jgi:two-component system alkaline phosphatase synthesis response regulator PhoP
MIRLLMVANDIEAITGLGESLVVYDFTYSVVPFDEAAARLAREPYDLVLVEIADNTPDSPSRTFLSDTKREKKLPVIALVSREILEEINTTLEIDDFITAPGSAAELALRVRRLLHKSENLDRHELIRCGALVIDLVSCEVAVDGKLVDLTYKEYEMLKLLAGNPGRVYTREKLLDMIWGYDYFGGDRTVDVHIRRLRSKIEDSRHTFIETVRNIGYRFKKTS